MAIENIEDYIKGVYKLESGGKKATTSALAKLLSVGDGSVTEMLRKLSDKQLIHYKPYQGVGLTEHGRRMALKILRRHRLWEMFLAQFLGYTWDEVHQQAERLEHITSDELERRLDKALGYPKVDPHGDPIPSADGELDHPEYTSLMTCEAGDVVKVLRVSDDEPQILQHATRLGVGLNTRITVREKMDFDGSMTIKVGTKQQFISREVAGAIFVERMD